jgi:hypothetical protein
MQREGKRGRGHTFNSMARRISKYTWSHGLLAFRLRKLCKKMKEEEEKSGSGEER